MKRRVFERGQEIACFVRGDAGAAEMIREQLGDHAVLAERSAAPSKRASMAMRIEPAK